MTPGSSKSMFHSVLPFRGDSQHRFAGLPRALGHPAEIARALSRFARNAHGLGCLSRAENANVGAVLMNSGRWHACWLRQVIGQRQCVSSAPGRDDVTQELTPREVARRARIRPRRSIAGRRRRTGPRSGATRAGGCELATSAMRRRALVGQMNSHTWVISETRRGPDGRCARPRWHRRHGTVDRMAVDGPVPTNCLRQ